MEIWIKQKFLKRLKILENGVGKKKKIGWVGWGEGGGKLLFYIKNNCTKSATPRPIDEEIQTPAGCEDVPIQFEQHTQERKGEEKKKEKKNIIGP